MSDVDELPRSLAGLCILGALVTGAVLLVPLLVVVRVVQVVREARGRG